MRIEINVMQLIRERLSTDFGISCVYISCWDLSKQMQSLRHSLGDLTSS